MGRHLNDGRGNPIVVFTPGEYKLAMDIFNNYAYGLGNERAMKKMYENYKLHLDIQHLLIIEKDKQLEALGKRVEFGDQLYKSTKDKQKTQEKRGKIGIVFGTLGGLGVGILAGFLVGVFAS